MLWLYPIPAFLRNHSRRPWIKNSAQFVDVVRLRIFPKVLTLFIPSLVASSAVIIWLNTRESHPPTGNPGNETTRGLKQNQAGARESHRAIQVVAIDPIFAPATESLEALFSNAQTDTQEPEPDVLPVTTAEGKALSAMEVHVNQTLLDTLDPYLMNREQLALFASAIPTGYPVPFLGINSPFGFRMHPTHQETRFHPGVDLKAPMNTPITATADGVVEFSGVDNGRLGLNGLGQVVSLHHNFGFRTTFSHLNKIHVKAGDFVHKGDLIGLTGQSGIVTAPHLHYEIRFIHQYLNPAPFLSWTQEQHERLFKEKSVQWAALLDQIGTRPAASIRQLARAEPLPKPTLAPATEETSIPGDRLLATPTLITERHLSKPLASR
ncbi:MAG: M23 family metallopeptidase [Magnetococcales bacterium]|nr:M23 family metallopeptidase [Magnetococcales bacterium]